MGALKDSEGWAKYLHHPLVLGGFIALLSLILFGTLIPSDAFGRLSILVQSVVVLGVVGTFCFSIIYIVLNRGRSKGDDQDLLVYMARDNPEDLAGYILRTRKSDHFATEQTLALPLPEKEEGEVRELASAITAVVRSSPEQPEKMLAALQALKDGETGEAEELLEVVLEDADLSAELRADASRHLGALRYLYDTPGSIAAYKRAIELNPEDAASLGSLGLLMLRSGNLDEAEKMHRRSLEIEESLGNIEGMASDYRNLGIVYAARGELDGAEKMCLKSLALEEAVGNKEGMASSYGNLGNIYATRGDLDEAEKMQHKALEIDKVLGRKEGMASDYGNLGIIYAMRDDLDEAEKMFTRSLEINKALGRKEELASDYGNLGNLYTARGDLDEAEKMHLKSLEIEEFLGHTEGMASDYGNLGGVYAERGDLKAAREHWEKAQLLYRSMGVEGKAEEMARQIEALDADPD